MYVLRNIFYQYGANVKLNLEFPNSVLIKNTGDVTVYVNNFPLDSGEMFTSNLLQANMQDHTNYDIRFDAAGTGNKMVNVIVSYVSEHKEVKDGAKC